MPRLGLKRATDAPEQQGTHTADRQQIAPRPTTAPVSRTVRPFTARQQAFIENYVVSKNASDAARKAGYAAEHVNVTGAQILSNPSIRAEIDARLAKQAEKLEITADRVRRNLAEVANGNVADFIKIMPDGSPVVDFSSMTREQAAALASVTVEEFKDGRSDKREVRRIKFAMADRVKANELLGKHFNLWTEQVEHTHTHQHTLMGRMLHEIDEESRSKLVEHEADEAA